MATAIGPATLEMKRLVEQLNKKAAEFRAEGLLFSFTADPAFPGVALMSPVNRFTFPG